MNFLQTETYLPHSISDKFHTPADIANWLDSIEEAVRATSETATYARALTWSGFHVYRNGYVVKFQ